MQLYPDEGLVYLLKLIANNGGAGLTWALFDNDVTPTLDSLLADFHLASATWAQVVLDDSAFVLEQVLMHNGSIQAAAHTFTNTTGLTQTVYGYLVFEAATHIIIKVERDPSAPVVIPAGSKYIVTPSFGDYSDVSIPEVDGGTF